MISRRQLALGLANVLMSRGRFGKLPSRPMKSREQIKAMVAKLRRETGKDGGEG